MSSSRSGSGSGSGISSSSTSIALGSSPLDQELSKWANENDYTIVESKPCGSSGWASFRKVKVVSSSKKDNENENENELNLFVKSSSRSAKEMFEGEALGLKAMYECSLYRNDNEDDDEDDNKKGSLRIPKVFHWGDYATGSGSLLIMEFLNLKGRSDDYQLGRAVARMHSAPAAVVAAAGNPQQQFGFAVDNTIGGTPQPNLPWKDDWVDFFATQRIGHQLELAGDSYCSNLWTNDIAPRLHVLFDYYNITVKPSLLHGDLWSGNIGSVEGGRPTIYDPATYWGHHEAEWGMSWCASFGRSFWEGYRSIIPEDEGFLERKPLYDAYHQLNHYNLFGGGYLGSARRDLELVKKNIDAAVR